jgi:hypothetical protein
MHTTYSQFKVCPLVVLMTALVMSALVRTDVVGHSAEQEGKGEAVVDVAAMEDAVDVGAKGGFGDAGGGGNLFVALVAEDEFNDGAVARGEFEFGGDFVPFIDRQREGRERGHFLIPVMRRMS